LGLNGGQPSTPFVNQPAGMIATKPFKNKLVSQQAINGLLADWLAV